MKTRLILVLLLFIAACKTPPNLLSISQEDANRKAFGEIRVFTLPICSELVSAFEPDSLPEIIPYPRFINCQDIYTDGNIPEEEIIDKAHIIVIQIRRLRSELFLYVSTRNKLRVQEGNPLSLEDLDNYYLGIRKGCSIYFKGASMAKDQADGNESSKHGIEELQKWEMNLSSTRGENLCNTTGLLDLEDLKSISIEKLPFFDEDNLNATLVDVNSVFDLTFKFKYDPKESYYFEAQTRDTIDIGIDSLSLETLGTNSFNFDEFEIGFLFGDQKIFFKDELRFVPPDEKEIKRIDERLVPN